MLVAQDQDAQSRTARAAIDERRSEMRDVLGTENDLPLLPRGTRIFFLIRSLERGGAERQLIELVDGLARAGLDLTVCTFYDGGALRRELALIRGVNVVSLGKRGRWDVPTFLLRLGRAVQAARPDVIHAYMGVANELSVLMAGLFGVRTVWGVRSSNMDFSHYDAFARRAFQIGALLSRFADGIIVNSQAGWDHCALHGYPRDRMTVVHNGIDCERFRPDPLARSRVRAELGVRLEQPLVALVGRLDPKKDHVNFLNAAALTRKRHPNARFVCVGDGPISYSRTLVAHAEALGLTNDLIWLPARILVQEVYNAADVVVLSSAFGEGFPNVVAEAMACEKRCVVTNVGDAAVAVGDVGIIVPPRNPTSLADGISCLLDLSENEARAMERAARQRIVNRFSKRQLAEATSTVLWKTLSSPRRTWR